MDQAVELTLEQEFSLRSFAEQVKQMSHEQTQEFLILQNQQMVMQKKMYEDLIKHEWNLD